VLLTKALAVALILTLLFSAVAEHVNLAKANPNNSAQLVLAMPKEYVNYTITRENGTWWAKIDGTYPLYILNESNDTSSCFPFELPMVYPTPPDTTNIHVKIDETELDWSNYPYEQHHTVIGNWPVILSVLEPTSDYFLLKIHYEHPIQLINGSYLFLYDLNIGSYLSLQSPTSTAYFTIRMETDASNLQAFTTETDSLWNPKNYTSQREGTLEVISIEMVSEFGKPLAGDLVITFSGSASQMPDELPYWIILPLLIIAALVAAMVYRRKRHSPETRDALSQPKRHT
jgi:hypothetical protein